MSVVISSRVFRFSSVLSLVLGTGALAACHPNPPASWDEGGSRLEIPEASWDRPGGKPLSIFRDGRVVVDGEVIYNIDRAGRITDTEYESVALLVPSGQLVGNDDSYLGRIGVRNATPPWSALAWLRVSPKGRMLFFDETGEAMFGGTWTGCEGAGLRVCTLVSQLVTLARVEAQVPNRPYYVGLRMGVWR